MVGGDLEQIKGLVNLQTVLLVIVILLSVVNLGNHSFGGKRASLYTFQGLFWRTLRLAVAKKKVL